VDLVGSMSIVIAVALGMGRQNLQKVLDRLARVDIVAGRVVPCRGPGTDSVVDERQESECMGRVERCLVLLLLKVML
jgi:hypothetical protein